MEMSCLLLRKHQPTTKLVARIMRENQEGASVTRKHVHRLPFFPFSSVLSMPSENFALRLQGAEMGRYFLVPPFFLTFLLSCFFCYLLSLFLFVVLVYQRDLLLFVSNWRESFTSGYGFCSKSVGQEWSVCAAVRCHKEQKRPNLAKYYA